MKCENNQKLARNSDTKSGSIEPERFILSLPVSSPSLPVSPAFRCWFLAHFHLSHAGETVSGENLKYLRLANYLLGAQGVWLSMDDGMGVRLIPVGQAQLREVMKPGCRDHNFNAESALNGFRSKMWGLVTEPYDYQQGQVRMVSSQQIPGALRIKLREELISAPDEFVDLVTGEPTRDRHWELAASEVPVVERLRTMLNGLDEARFAPLVESLMDAKVFVERQEWDVESKRRELTILRQLESGCRTNYKAVAGTSRLYTEGPSWLGLKRPVRDRLSQAYWKLDLKAAQLHIAAGLWGWEIDNFKVDGSVWTYLLHRLGRNKSNIAVKDGLKRFVYACIFGASARRLRHMAEQLGDSGLIRDPLIRTIIESRQKVIDHLESGGQLLDAWGRQYQVTETQLRKRAKEVRSIMAAICQSYELRLLIPVIDIGAACGCNTVAVLHDCIYGVGPWDGIVDRLQTNLKALSQGLLGVKVELEVSPPRVAAQLSEAA